jgi:hypothetical protein
VVSEEGALVGALSKAKNGSEMDEGKMSRTDTSSKLTNPIRSIDTHPINNSQTRNQIKPKRKRTETKTKTNAKRNCGFSAHEPKLRHPPAVAAVHSPSHALRSHRREGSIGESSTGSGANTRRVKAPNTLGW